ncbi:MAG: hypothetical protein ACQESK_04665 [Bacteroidota bacterium]
MKKSFWTITLLFIMKCGYSQDRTDTLYIEKSKTHSVYILPEKSLSKTKFLLDNKESYVSLNVYQGEYYLYSPCDEVEHTQIKIENDTIHFYLGEKISYEIISRDMNVKNNKRIYVLNNKQNGSVQMEVKTIDEEKGIKVFRLVFMDLKKEVFYLMIKSEVGSKFPLIVNDCKDEKRDEFKFEKQNLKKYF